MVERVGALVPAHVADDQAGLGEEPQVARDTLPRDVEAPRDVVRAEGATPVVQRREDATPGLVGQRLEDPVEVGRVRRRLRVGGSGRPTVNSVRRERVVVIRRTLNPWV